MRYKLIAALLISIIPVGFVYAALQYSVTISTHGIIISREFNFYSDSACASKVSSIDWGTLEPGQQVNRTLYMKSSLASDVSASLAVRNFEPAVGSSYLVLAWDYLGAPIASGQVLLVTFTLRVASTVTGISLFSFDIEVQPVDFEESAV